MGTLTVNGKTANVVYCDDSRIERLHFTVPTDDFEQYKDVDGEIGFNAATWLNSANVTAHGQTVTAEIKSYTIVANIDAPFEMTVVLDIQ